MTTINIRDLVGRDILNRISAHDILSAASACGDSKVSLDFDGVQFTTRSFMDEFYNQVKTASLSGLNITVTNMSDDLRQMYVAVSKTQKGGTTKITMKPYSRPKSISEMERIFAQMSI
jgi:anti-anti-sigma regulatory factor